MGARYDAWILKWGDRVGRAWLIFWLVVGALASALAVWAAL